MKYEEVAKRLREAMNDKKMKAAELSKRTGIGKASISHYINGLHCPNNESAILLAKVLQVNETWLMGFDSPKHKEHKVFTVNDTFTGCSDDIFSDEVDSLYMELIEEIAKLDKDFMIPLLGIVKRYNEERGES